MLREWLDSLIKGPDSRYLAEVNGAGNIFQTCSERGTIIFNLAGALVFSRARSHVLRIAATKGVHR